MENGYQRVSQAVDDLMDRRPREGWGSPVRIGPQGRSDEALLMKDHLENLHLVVELPQGRERFYPPLGKTLPVDWISPQNTGFDQWRIDVQCEDQRLVPTFISLVGEMLDRSEASARPVIDELVASIASWRAALARELTGISRSQLTGLFGELLILERLAMQDPRRALHVWRGQSGERHDFADKNSLETKTFTGSGSSVVTIHGETQLDPPPGGQLHLVAFRVEEHPTGDTLSDVADRVETLGISRLEMENRSTEESPIVLDDDLRFAVREILLFAVGDDFPGIRRSTVSANVFEGVTRVNYRLDLNQCPGRLGEGNLDDVLAEL